MIKVVRITDAFGLYPTQLYGYTDKGENVYIRWRHHYLTVGVAFGFWEAVDGNDIGVDTEDSCACDYRKVKTLLEATGKIILPDEPELGWGGPKEPPLHNKANYLPLDLESVSK